MSGEATVPIRTYLIIYAALLGLLLITFGLAYIPTGNYHGLRDVLTIVGFTIAAIKGVLIVLWFMHVKAGTRLTWIFSAAAFVWFGIMLVLTLNDYWTRDYNSDDKPRPQLVLPAAAAQENGR